MYCQAADAGTRHVSVPTAGAEEETLWHHLMGAGHTCRATSSTPRVVVRPVHNCSWCHPSAAERWLLWGNNHDRPSFDCMDALDIVPDDHVWPLQTHAAHNFAPKGRPSGADLDESREVPHLAEGACLSWRSPAPISISAGPAGRGIGKPLGPLDTCLWAGSKALQSSCKASQMNLLRGNN